MIDVLLLKDVQAAEGCRLVAYKDTRGFWTIGYGHKLEEGIDWSGHEISQKVADQLLQLDLENALAEAMTLPEWPELDTPCRRNAVTELVFNMGLTHWEGFHHCRAAIRWQDWPEAAQQLTQSAWALEVGPRRSMRLAQYLALGAYSAP